MLRRLLIQKNEELVRANDVLRENYTQIISAMRLLVDTKDIYTRGHSDRVAYYAVRLAREMGRDEDFCERLRVRACSTTLEKSVCRMKFCLKTGG